MAKASGLNQTAVSRIWRAFALQPHRQETFKLSSDPLFIDKVRDIVGVYMEPPTRGGAVRGREIPDPGTEPHPAAAADKVRRCRAAHA